MRNELVVSSPVGMLRLGASPKGLLSIDVGKSTTSYPTTAKNASAQRVLAATSKQLAEYFAGQRTSFTIPLDLRGTAFQIKSWKALSRIPYGKTISYGRQAQNIGNPKACRAVGSANSKNPIPIIVPCHRVVSADGSLGGFSLGLKMKKQLLDLERSS
jgi:methylated-DNA-[protein]-cysteine S-methyltransferase